MADIKELLKKRKTQKDTSALKYQNATSAPIGEGKPVEQPVNVNKSPLSKITRQAPQPAQQTQPAAQATRQAVQQTMQATTKENPLQNLAKSIEETKTKQKVLSFQEALEQAKARRDQSIQEVGQQAQEQRTSAGVTDVMQRQAERNRLATGGLSSSGAMVQSNIASNIANQSRLGGIGQAEQQALTGIGRDFAQAERQAQFGTVQAELAGQLAGQQSELAIRQQQDAQAFQAKESALDRAFTMTRDEADRKFTMARDQALNLNQLQRDQILNQYNQENMNIQYQLQEASKNNDVQRQQFLMKQQHELNLQMEAFRSVNEMDRLGQSQNFQADQAQMDREFTLLRDQYANMNQAERDSRLQGYEQQNMALGAEIQRARDMNNAELESQLVAQRAEIDKQMEAISHANRMGQIGYQGQVTRQNEEFRQQFNQQPGQQVDDKMIVGALDSVASRIYKPEGASAEEMAEYNTQVMRSQAQQLAQLFDSGQIDEATARRYQQMYGITDDMVMQARGVIN